VGVNYCSCSLIVVFLTFFFFKFFIQFFDDCNGVDHASVPRKLRSGVWFMNQNLEDFGINNSSAIGVSVFLFL
jgi:hypothetical protein